MMKCNVSTLHCCFILYIMICILIGRKAEGNKELELEQVSIHCDNNRTVSSLYPL